jgi:hypothetical protein
MELFRTGFNSKNVNVGFTYCEHSDTGIGFSLNISVFPCQLSFPTMPHIPLAVKQGIDNGFITGHSSTQK